MLELIKREAKACYEIYAALYNSHINYPDIFTVSRCTGILTALMGSHNWSWRVVGITPQALKIFKDNDFKKIPSGGGITRAHITSRKSTCEDLIKSNKIFSPDDFINKWLENDKTVICGKGENKDNFFAKYISIDNPFGILFQSAKVGWKCSKSDREYLRSLYEESLAVKRLVIEIFSHITSKRKQALILNHYGIVLPDFPSMFDIGFVDKDGWFCVAGGRVQSLERESIDEIERLVRPFMTDELLFTCEKMAAAGDPYASLLIAIWEKRGTYIENPDSRPSDWDGKSPAPCAPSPVR